jgi:hypothetical protein
MTTSQSRSHEPSQLLNSSLSEVSTDPKVFQYQPLNHNTSSIRLLGILPNTSPEGYIQCTLKNATVNAEYTCLSYVWGPPNKGCVILVNGQQYRVRRNLFDFLEVSRVRHTEKLLWIDALCIDQDNVVERNHQVQQMGDIYSNAKHVLAWLGNAKIIRQHLAEVSKYGTPYLSAHRGDLWGFLGASYWKRAWITQEVLLARRVTLCAGSVELDTLRLLLLCEQGYRLPLTVRDLISPTTNLKRASLIRLLVEHRWKECHIPRDRIYSLLSVCGEGSDLRVDYQVSDEEVFLQTIRSCPESVCFCSVACVAHALKCFPNPKTQIAASKRVTEKPFVQLPAKTAVRTTVDGEHRLKCWDCDTSWPYDLARGPFLIVCPSNVCHFMSNHLVIETSTVGGRQCISRCHIGNEDLGHFWDIRALDSGIALTESEPQSGIFSVCLGLTWVLEFSRPFHKGGVHWSDNESASLASVPNRMRICDHDSHAE